MGDGKGKNYHTIYKKRRPLIKQLWVWVEARQVAGEVSAFDEWVRVGVDLVSGHVKALM